MWNSPLLVSGRTHSERELRVRFEGEEHREIVGVTREWKKEEVGDGEGVTRSVQGKWGSEY